MSGLTIIGILMEDGSQVTWVVNQLVVVSDRTTEFSLQLRKPHITTLLLVVPTLHSVGVIVGMGIMTEMKIKIDGGRC